MDTTRLSTKGQIVLPKALREAHGWRAGTVFVLESTKDGVLVRASRKPAASRLEDVAGSLKGKGGAKSLGRMTEAVDESLMERHARGRY